MIVDRALTRNDDRLKYNITANHQDNIKHLKIRLHKIRARVM